MRVVDDRKRIHLGINRLLFGVKVYGSAAEFFYVLSAFADLISYVRTKRSVPAVLRPLRQFRAVQ